MDIFKEWEDFLEVIMIVLWEQKEEVFQEERSVAFCFQLPKQGKWSLFYKLSSKLNFLS